MEMKMSFPTFNTFLNNLLDMVLLYHLREIL